MKKQLLILCCGVLLVSSCASTKVINTWKENSHPAQYSTIFVVALAKDSSYRRLLERQLVNSFKEAGLEARITYDIFPDSEKTDKKAATNVIRNMGGDGVMVVRLIDKKAETHYQRGKTYGGAGYAVYDSNGWHGYYEEWGTPDTVVDQKISLVESIFFDVDKEKRVWSVITKTTESSISESIYSYSKAIGKQLKSSGLF